MNILTYKPSIKVYAECRRKDGYEYYDLSNDVAYCNTYSAPDGCGTCTVSLQNRRGKYNGVFSPMDRITVSAVKNGNETRIFTGYIRTVPKFRLFEQDFNLDCKDSLYVLQRLYWDPALMASIQLMTNYNAQQGFEQGFFMSKTIWNLMTKVSNWNADMIRMDYNMPQQVVDFAYSMWQAKQSDITGLENTVEDFYNILKSTGTKTSPSSTQSSNGSQKAMVSAATANDLYGSQAGYCEEWAEECARHAGIDCDAQPCATAAFDAWSVSQDKSSIPAGAAVFGYSNPQVGDGQYPDYGHVGICIGDDQIVSNRGGSTPTQESLDSWMSVFGFKGWGWMGGHALA